MAFVQLKPRRISIETEMLVEHFENAVRRVFIDETPITPEVMRGKKGLVRQSRGPIYRIENRGEELAIREISRGGTSSSGSTVFVARCKIASLRDGRVVEINIPPSIGISITMYVWMAASFFGMVWNLIRSFRQGVFLIETVLSGMLMVVGVLVLFLSNRMRTKRVDQLLGKMRSLLKAEDAQSS
jgi:hypothetical protein